MNIYIYIYICKKKNETEQYQYLLLSYLLCIHTISNKRRYIYLFSILLHVPCTKARIVVCACGIRVRSQKRSHSGPAGIPAFWHSGIPAFIVKKSGTCYTTNGNAMYVDILYTEYRVLIYNLQRNSTRYYIWISWISQRR